MGGAPRRDIVCFANDWAGDPLSKKHIMRRLARRGRVLWVESLGNRPPRLDGHDARRVLSRLGRFARGLVEVEQNLWVLSPLAIPAYGSQAAARANAFLVGATVRAAMSYLGLRRPITYSFVPASAWVAGRLGEARVVYHCVDEYAAFAGAGERIAVLEQRLLRRADLVLVCSEPLLESKRRWNPRIQLVRHGVDHAHFARALDESTPIPADLARLPRPVIGFFGLVAEWVDLALVRRVADAFPSASIAILGEVRASTAALDGASNVHVLGRRPYAELPGCCRAFDVALLPFVVDELTWSASPLKLREYLAAGLPVVSTDLPEARALAPWVHAANGDQFVAAVGRALVEPTAPEARAARSQAMAGETWDHKVAEIEAALDALVGLDLDEGAAAPTWKTSPARAS